MTRRLLFAIGLLAAASNGWSDAWSLWTNGALRGANIYQRRVYPSLDGGEFLGPGPVGPPYTQADFNALAALGANYVNLSHPGLFAEAPPYALDTGAQSNLDALIALADNAGLKVVISFRTGPGRSEFSILRDGAGDWFPAALVNDAIWTNAAAQNAWTNMWKYTAARYASHSNVVGFDLMVEPNADDAIAKTYDPVTFYQNHAGTLLDWNQLHPKISTAIRSVNTNTPIIIGGEDYSSLAWMPWLRTNGSARVVYAAHQYAPDAYTHQSGSAIAYPGVFDADDNGHNVTVDRAWLAARFQIAANFRAQHHVPVAINEFGLERWAPGAAQFLDDSMGLMRSLGLSQAIWMWHASWPAYNPADDDFNFMHGTNRAAHTDQPDNPLLRIIRKHWRAEKSRAAVDFDGDGASDFGVFHPASGNWFLLRSALGGFVQNWGWNAVTPVPADFDGDGKTDIAVFHPAAGNWYILKSSTGEFIFQNWGWADVRPVPADYDGDGKADLAVYHPATGDWYIRQSSNGALAKLNWGWSAAKPVPADYTGDGKADLAVYFAGTGMWYVRRSEDGQLRQTQFGGPGFAPVPADYDGDGRTDLAVWEAAKAIWYIAPSGGGPVRVVAAGAKGKMAAPGDYDGDGRADPCTFDPGKNNWAFLSSASGTSRAQTWGLPGALPIRSAAIP